MYNKIMEFWELKEKRELVWLNPLLLMNGDPQNGLLQSSFCATLFSVLDDTLKSGTSESLFSLTTRF